MNLFDVYPLFDVNIVKGKGCHVWDDKGQEYLDLYGGHAVISVGHCHPHYIEKLTRQLGRLGFYSNSLPISPVITCTFPMSRPYFIFYRFFCFFP